MAIWDMFKKPKEEPVMEKVDPIVEQRRKEKFSTPLIYNDEEPKKEAKVENTKSSSVTATKKPVSKPTNGSVPPKFDSSYTMSEVISPFFGKTEESKPTSKTSKTQPKKKVRKKSIEDQLVPVISPIFGADSSLEEEYEYEEVEAIETPVEKEVEVKPQVKKQNDTASLDINDILKAESDNLKVVEKRTGEFQFDLLKPKAEEKSTAEEIDDAMTLDELMSIYEKKYKDGGNE